MRAIYIAGPMSGYPEFNFPSFFAAEQQLHDKLALTEDEGFRIFNPAERDNQRHGTDISVGNATGSLNQAAEEHGFSLREALAMDCGWIAEEATHIYMLRGWEASKGATAERALALALGVVILYEEGADEITAKESAMFQDGWARGLGYQTDVASMHVTHREGAQHD